VSGSRAPDIDTVIVGQGIAGTSLAWALLAAGQRVLVLDADEPVTSSKIAAGLITPITGQRLALSWRIAEMLPAARAFYDRVEQQTGVRVFHNRQAVRLFASDLEREIWTKRRDKPEFIVHVAQHEPGQLIDASIADASGGGFAMQTAQLDVARYLSASRDVLPVRHANIDWQRDVTFDDVGVTIAGLTASVVVSCEGHRAQHNPYFSDVSYKPAKGDILTVRLARPMAPVPLHQGIWAAPTSEPDIWRVGATYDWENLRAAPCERARAEIEQGLKRFLNVPYEVIDHRAAVRPIIRESKALIGFHPGQPRLGFFNGLGSKGSLHAPFFAEMLAAHIVDRAPIAPEFDVGLRLRVRQ
jgi:glycine oxidase